MKLTNKPHKLLASAVLATALVFTAAIPAQLASAAPMSTPTPSPVQTTDMQKAVDAVIGTDVKGIQVQVVDDKKIKNYKAGSADKNGRPVPDNSKFRAGSITKPVTAITVLQLVDEGKLKLDDPVAKYLPRTLTDGDKITVRMLLQHTSGLADPTESKDFSLDPAVKTSAQYTSYVPEEIVKLVNDMPRKAAPGIAWNYSNANYTVLQMLIENRAGNPYPKEATARVLKPLGMKDSLLPGYYMYMPAPYTRGYEQGSDGKLYDLSKQNMSWAEASGSLVSTTSDLNKLTKSLLSGSLLSPASYQEMYTIQNSFGVGYGLGLVAKQLPCGAIVFGHNGNVLGYYSEAFASADGSKRVSISMNLAGSIERDPAKLVQKSGAILETVLCKQ